MATDSRTTQRTVFHVTTRDGKWVVTREGYPAGEFDSFETKEEAMERARTEARQQSPSQVKIHRTDGAIEDEYTYENDPFPPS
jgi:hypothetical protein